MGQDGRCLLCHLSDELSMAGEARLEVVAPPLLQRPRRQKLPLRIEICHLLLNARGTRAHIQAPMNEYLVICAQ
jgi:hypothetical protein